MKDRLYGFEFLSDQDLNEVRFFFFFFFFFFFYTDIDMQPGFLSSGRWMIRAFF